MGNIVGEKIDKWVSNEIATRQSLQYSGFEGKRTPSQINVLTNQNAWLKLASSVRVIDDKIGEGRLRSIGLLDSSNYTKDGLARKTILFNTLSTLSEGSTYSSRAGVTKQDTLWNGTNIYGIGGSKFGLSPSPGLISAKIDCKNRGSIREATIELKCYNQFQFQLIELVYLRLGYSMILEWGWDKYMGGDKTGPKIETTGNTIIEDIWFKDNSLNFQSLLDNVEVYRKKYNANYDGFIGKVVNFDWKFDPDGTYNITLKLITVGDVIESLNVNLPLANISVSSIKVEAETNTNTSEILDSTVVTTAGNSTLNYDLYTDITDSNSLKWTEVQGNYMGWYNQLNFGANQININNEDPVEAGAIANLDNYNYFLTFGEFLRKLEALIMPSISGTVMLSLDYNEEENICSAFPYLISLDPKVCLIKPIILDEYAFGNGKPTYINNTWKWMKNMKPFGVVENDGKTLYGKIMNIFLNYDFVTKCINETTEKNNLSLFKLLEKICTGINGALGNVTQLEPVIIKDRSVTIIDQSPINGIELSTKFKDRFVFEPTPFEILGYNTTLNSSNFVRDFGFNTKITPQLASMISIGAASQGIDTKNYDGTSFSKWNEGLKDAYQRDYKDPAEELAKILSAISPFSPSQLDNILQEFNKSDKDLVKGLPDWVVNFGGKERPDNKLFTSGYGKQAEGVRDIEKCPVTGRYHKGKNWAEYSKEVANFITAEINKKEKENDVKAENSNYISYLTTAFGGSFNSKITSATPATAKYFQLNPDFISQGKASFKAFQTALNNEIYIKDKTPSNVIGFIPLDLNLSCNGLSGIKIYQELEIRQDFLPAQYSKALKFLITKVNHDISDNDWKTSLSTVSTAVTKGFTNLTLNITQVANQVVGGIVGNASFPQIPSILPSLGISNTSPSAPSSLGKSAPSSLGKRDTIYVDTTRNEKARAAAIKFLGKPISGLEWNQLVAATFAESSDNTRERANVMAVILRRARPKGKNITEVLFGKNQFQAVTGDSENGHQPKPLYVKGPSPKAALDIDNAAINLLPNLQNTYNSFSAAATKAYKAGTNIAHRDKIIANKGEKIGGTVFADLQPPTKKKKIKKIVKS